MPRITVLMAVHNGEVHLQQAIDSILGQTFRDFEFLIVDDGSIDRTREIILGYDDPRIRLLENECNLGLARSLNLGLAVARGQFVARQDADDISEPERLERQLRFLDAHPDVVLLGTCHTEIDEDGRLIRRHRLPCDHTSIRWALLFHCPFVHSAVMFHRASVLREFGGYDESLSYAMDFELWSRIATRFPVANLNEVLVRLRTHSRSMTATYGDRAREGERLRGLNMARMLGWPEHWIENREARHQAVEALYRGKTSEHEVERVLQAVQDILLIQEVFCDEAGLGSEESRRHRKKVLRDVADRLVAYRKQQHSSLTRGASLRLTVAIGTCRLRASVLSGRGRWARMEANWPKFGRPADAHPRFGSARGSKDGVAERSQSTTYTG